ncbi:MAG: hypothetical protein OEZ36_14420 [Spirochaetota bacterium]|nr:hypothetical protein [Spirochaetota bacterium]
MTPRTCKLLIVMSVFLVFKTVGLRANGFYDRENVVNFDEDRMFGQTVIKKDPVIAGLLSSVMPGVGQIYSESYTKGSVIILGDLVAKTALIATIISLTNKYSSVDNSLVEWDQLNGNDKSLLISVSIAYIGLYIWNIIDAVNVTTDYNNKYLNEPTLKIGYSTKENNFEIQYCIMF